jgi:hypothetical protein
MFRSTGVNGQDGLDNPDRPPEPVAAQVRVLPGRPLCQGRSLPGGRHSDPIAGTRLLARSRCRTSTKLIRAFSQDREDGILWNLFDHRGRLEARASRSTVRPTSSRKSESSHASGILLLSPTSWPSDRS